MGLFDQFPYTNFHELNLMWILEALKEIQTTTEQFVAINSLKYANPIQWNIVKQYEKNTIVIDPLTGTAYISVQPVPTGVALTNEDYWTVVFNLREFVVRAAKNFTTRWEEDTTLTATFNTAAGQWLVWGDTLYRANVNITAGDSYVVDGNITKITVEEIKDEIYTYFDGKIGELTNLSTTDKDNIVAAINEIVSTISQAVSDLQDAITSEAAAREDADDAINNTIGDLDDLSTVDKSNIVAAINEVNQTGGGAVSMIGDLDDLSTVNKSNVVAAINELVYTDTAIRETIANDFVINVLFPPTGLDALDNTGTTDNSVKLQAIIEYLQTTGGCIYFPRGIYKISSTVNVPYIKIKFLGEGGMCAQIITYANISIFNVTADRFIEFENLIFRNLYASPTNPNGAIIMNSSHRGFIHNCLFYNFNRAIVLRAARGTKIEFIAIYFETDFTFTGSNFAIIMEGNNASTRIMHFECAMPYIDNSILFFGIYNNDWVQDLFIDDFETSGGYRALWLNNTTAQNPGDLQIRNCTFDLAEGVIFKIDNVKGSSYENTCVIENIYVTPSTHGNVRLIDITKSANISIRGIHINNPSRIADTLQGMRIDQCDGIILEDSLFTGIYNGLNVTNSGKCIISSNIFKAYDGIGTNGIATYGNTDCNFINNIFNGLTNSLIVNADSTRSLVALNTGDGTITNNSTNGVTANNMTH